MAAISTIPTGICGRSRGTRPGRYRSDGATLTRAGSRWHVPFCVRRSVNMTMTIGIREARARLAELVDRAEQGETLVITRSGREVARLGPPARHEQRRP